MAKQVTLSDLVSKLSSPTTIEAPAKATVTPALALLLNSPTRLKEQLENNLPGMTISIRRQGEKFFITSVKKANEQATPRRLPSSKPRR